MVCYVARFLLSTGARLNEALSAKWSDIDRQNRVWKISQVVSKSKKGHSKPLNDSAIDVLNELGTEGKFEHLFISSKTGERLSAIHKVWDRLRRKARLNSLRIHDLRHMHATMMINSGHSLFHVMQVLGHSDPSVTQRYAHISKATLDGASDSVSRIIKAAMQPSV